MLSDRTPSQVLRRHTQPQSTVPIIAIIAKSYFLLPIKSFVSIGGRCKFAGGIHYGVQRRQHAWCAVYLDSIYTFWVGFHARRHTHAVLCVRWHTVTKFAYNMCVGECAKMHRFMCAQHIIDDMKSAYPHTWSSRAAAASDSYAESLPRWASTICILSALPATPQTTDALTHKQRVSVRDVWIEVASYYGDRTDGSGSAMWRTRRRRRRVPWRGNQYHIEHTLFIVVWPTHAHMAAERQCNDWCATDCLYHSLI